MQIEQLIQVGGCGLAALCVVVLAEIAARRGLIRGEVARKSTHFGIGLVLLIWLSLFGVETYRMCVAAASAATLVLWPTGVFKSMSDVQRKTIGHLLYPFGLLLVASLFDDVTTNQVALLHLFAVDTMAALAGKAWGKKTIVAAFESRKTYVGSGAFWLGSFATFAWFWHSTTDMHIAQLLTASIIASGLVTISELAGFWGSDNLYLPLLSAWLFSML